MSEARHLDAIRVIPELRSVHIERYFRYTPAQTFYFRRNFDLGDMIPPRQIVQVNLLTLLVRLFGTSAHVLEVPEPLWVRFLPKWIVICAAWKLSGAFKPGSRRIVTYAMENNAFSRLVAGDRSLPRAVIALVRVCVGIAAGTFLDRVAFGTPGAQATYATLPFFRAEQRLFLELPQAHREPRRGPKHGHHAVFIGALETRKGLRPLMDAWQAVEQALPDAVLTIVGGGPLEAEIQEWVAERPTARRFTGLLARDAVLELLDDQDVLVLPSIPHGRWREQVGLPIKEGLAAGLTVVTTDQTGLASWLAAHDHMVVPTGPMFTTGLAQAVIGALSNPLDRDAVRAALPARESRQDADAWMHGADRQPSAELFVVNPLANALAHYTTALVETLGNTVPSVAVVQLQEPSSGRSRLGWVAEYFSILRSARRQGAPVIVLWPVLGYLDAIAMRVLVGPHHAALVVHDPRPLVRSVGNGPVARWLAAHFGRSTRLLAHSGAALEHLREDGFTRNVEYVPHPVRQASGARTGAAARTTKDPVVRVLGQYKADRDLNLLADVAVALGAGVRKEIVGRGWPTVPGWNVRSAFVDEDEMDELLRTADAVLIPYRRFYQSGVAIRALEVGTPFVGPRASSLADLYAEHEYLLPIDGGANAWAESIRSAMNADPGSIHAELEDAQRRAALGWRTVADQIDRGRSRQ